MDKLLAWVTGKPRYRPKIEWSSNSWTHNIFRVWELIFGRRFGIRAESSRNEDGTYAFHSFEAVVAFIESTIRGFVPVFEIEKIYIPVFQPANAPVFSQPYLFAISFNTVQTNKSASGTSNSYIHTCTGSDRMLFGGLWLVSGSDGGGGQAATYDSVSMTTADRRSNWFSGAGSLDLFVIHAPTTGNNTMAYSWTSSQSGRQCSTSYTGANQSSTVDNTGDAAGSSTSASVSVVSVADNCWGVAVIGVGNSKTVANTSGGVMRTTNAQITMHDTNVATTPAGSITLSGSVTTTGSWGIVMATFAPAGAVGSFSYYKAITIDESLCGTADTTNFAMLVSGTDADLKVTGSGGHVTSSSGYDIAFYSDSTLTTPLSFELRKYVSTTGEHLFWVKVPTLSASTNTVIYMAYGNASITTNSSNTGTWRSSFLRVFHTDDGTTLDLGESSGYSANGTNSSATATSMQVNGGVNFVAGSSQSFNAPQNGQMAIATGAFSIRFWFNTADTALGRLLSWYDGTNSLQLTRIGGQQQGIVLAIRAGAGDSGSLVDSLGLGYSGINRFVYTHNGSGTYKLYKDGADVTQIGYGGADLTAFTSNSTTMYVGQRGNGSYISGQMDEVWIETTDITLSEVIAEYNNQNSPGTFYSTGSEIPVTPAADIIWYMTFV